MGIGSLQYKVFIDASVYLFPKLEAHHNKITLQKCKFTPIIVKEDYAYQLGISCLHYNLAY